MMLFAMLAGSVLGVRGGLNLTGTRRRAVIQFILAGAIWSVAALAFAGPVILAEGSAHDGDDQFRGRHYDAAAADYLRAFQTVPYNADYAYRAGLAVAYEPNRDNQAIKELLDQAIAANPSAVNYYLSRARIDGEQRDLAAMKADFSRALELNPNEVSIHLDYADALNALGQSADATEQDQLALKYNDLLQPDEPKRLSPQRVAEIHKQINP
jgi:tetratricopeptide (TPR) repeat protein